MFQKLTEMHDALSSLVPLLAKILAHLEAQSTAPHVPIATYTAIYEADHPIMPGPPEGELVAEARTHARIRQGGWWARLFTQRIES